MDGYINEIRRLELTRFTEVEEDSYSCFLTGFLIIFQWDYSNCLSLNLWAWKICWLEWVCANGKQGPRSCCTVFCRTKRRKVTLKKVRNWKEGKGLAGMLKGLFSDVKKCIRLKIVRDQNWHATNVARQILSLQEWLEEGSMATVPVANSFDLIMLVKMLVSGRKAIRAAQQYW